MKKLLAIVLALALLVLCCAGCGSKEDKKLLVATNAEFEPFESLTAEGEFVGFDIDLMNAIAAKMGYEVQYENMEFDGVVAAVANGTTDLAISGLTINAKRAKSVNFSDPYYDGAAQVLIVAKNDTYYTGTDKATLDNQLKGQNIGVCSGYTGQFYAEGSEDWGFQKIEGATVKIYENISLAIADLKAGNINAIIMDDSVAKEAASANSDVAKVIDVALTVEEYGIAIDKTNPELKEKVDAALAELVEDGTVDKLLKKYGLK
jgi:polar amino acid transport system substrate-binding protein